MYHHHIIDADLYSNDSFFREGLDISKIIDCEFVYVCFVWLSRTSYSMNLVFVSFFLFVKKDYIFVVVVVDAAVLLFIVVVVIHLLSSFVFSSCCLFFLSRDSAVCAFMSSHSVILPYHYILFLFLFYFICDALFTRVPAVKYTHIDLLK